MSILTLKNVKETYEKYIDETDKNNFKKDEKNIWYSPSSAGACIKKHLFKKLGTKQDPIDQLSKFTMHYGTMVHKDLERALNSNFKEQDIRLLIETKFKDTSLNIRGSVDIIAINNEGMKEIIDIKTIKAFKWKRLFGRKENRDPFPNIMYELQLGTYGLMVKNVEYLSLLYWRKDDGLFKKVTVSIKYIELAREYWEEVNETVNENINKDPDNLVPGECINIPVEEKWECNWCSYSSKCNSRFKKEK